MAKTLDVTLVTSTIGDWERQDGTIFNQVHQRVGFANSGLFGYSQGGTLVSGIRLRRMLGQVHSPTRDNKIQSLMTFYFGSGGTLFSTTSRGVQQPVLQVDYQWALDNGYPNKQTTRGGRTFYDSATGQISFPLYMYTRNDDDTQDLSNPMVFYPAAAQTEGDTFFGALPADRYIFAHTPTRYSAPFENQLNFEDELISLPIMSRVFGNSNPTNLRRKFRFYKSTSASRVALDVSPQIIAPDTALRSTNIRKRIIGGDRVITRAYLGQATSPYWQQSNPPVITSFTASPSSADLDTATGNITLRVVGTGFTEGKFINKTTGAVVQNFATTTGTATATTPIPQDDTTYTVVLTNATGATSRDVNFTVTKNPVISNLRVSYIPGRATHGITAVFTAIIDGRPRPTVVVRDLGSIATISARHFTKRSDGRWDLSYSHYFGVPGGRLIDFTATNSSGSTSAGIGINVP